MEKDPKNKDQSMKKDTKAREDQVTPCDHFYSCEDCGGGGDVPCLPAFRS